LTVILDRISFLSVAFVRGKREIAQKYGKDRKEFIEAAFLKVKSSIPQK